MANRLPFDCIIVTSPDVASAQSSNGAVEFLKRHIQRKYRQEVRLVSTCDPFGARCGSGGGTIAALEYASPDESVLVLHAGGDSSRCPTQMILGKAWTCMPNAQYRNPTIWLLDQLVSLYEVAKFPKGTLIVAATDCLLSFFEKGEDIPSTWNCQYSSKSVLGVAVPAPLETAKNHGVYIMAERVVSEGSLGNKFNGSLVVEDPLDVWQKPSIEKLTYSNNPSPACFDLPMKKGKQAWIDTGLVVFLPEATSILYTLAEGTLSRCTRQGLKSLYSKEKENEEQSLDSFARANALKIDLYTDILHNLSWPGQAREEGTQLSPLQQSLSQITLEVLLAPSGAFLHLGTSKELLNFFTQATYPRFEEVANMVNIDPDAFATMQPRFQCWCDPAMEKNVAAQSTFPNNCTIGASSLVEYCDLASYESVSIGDNCILSGWRNTTNESSSLNIPNNLCVQHLSLSENDGEGKVAYMVYGIEDPIKTERHNATIYGWPVQAFEKKTGIVLDQLGWTADGTMWTAKLHPISPSGTSFSSIFGWLEEMHGDSESISQSDSLKEWLSSTRVSLKDLHQVANADAEWAFRRQLELDIIGRQQQNFIQNLQSLLRLRCHDQAISFQWLFEIEETPVALNELSRVLQALEEVALEELGLGHYDISGRAFMLESAILADFVSSTTPSSLSIQNQMDSILKNQIEALQRNGLKDERLAMVSKLVKQQRSDMASTEARNLAAYSAVTEQLALNMNELCVADGLENSLKLEYGDNWLARRTEPPAGGAWVMAMAPARVDIAGGWSDTPPICYEFGGSVTGMAALVDGFMPLSCRCRIQKGGSGLLLRSEIRENRNGSLSSVVETEVSKIEQFSDFRDPLSDCALIKCAMVVLGLLGENEINAQGNIQDRLNEFCSSQVNVRLEVVTTSLLPQGSGMGTSSILGGCTLRSIADAVGIRELRDDCLIHSILMLEQLLSSGGGWQDQVHGTFPLIKTVRSEPGKLPLRISVEQLVVDTAILKKLEERLVLVFTGQTRLAKNILQNVLRQWARRANEVVDTVKRLIACSETARFAVLQGDFDLLGKQLIEYSRLKARMAGKESGVEPLAMKYLTTELLNRDLIRGYTVCGAGGGGFMLLLMSECCKAHHISELVDMELSKKYEALKFFTWHQVRLSSQGLTTKFIEKMISAEEFDLEWQRVD
eukprot:scaffold1830_cov117-Cylindrotheca_fusiformis.AAC.12